jgi:hypothetical protein
LEDAAGLTADTELLIYFVGHSVSVGDSDLGLILGLTADGADRPLSLSWLLRSVQEHTPIRKIVLVLDTCHAGRTRGVLRLDGFEVFAMFATGSTYAFDAVFSDSFLRALEQKLQKSDQRIDRRAGGVTYRKLFEDARRRVLFSAEGVGREQEPDCFGDYGGTVLLPVSAAVSNSYNKFASSRSIYARLYRLMQVIHRTGPTGDQLRAAIDAEDIFLIRKDRGDGAASVSTERLSDYLSFLRQVRWLVQPHGRYQLTDEGRGAIDDLFFNRLLLDAIETYIFAEGVTLDFLDDIVKELLADMIPPTPVRIKDRAAMKGKLVDLSDATRLALQLLPSTGKFLKGAADAIYPSEYGG